MQSKMTSSKELEQKEEEEVKHPYAKITSFYFHSIFPLIIWLMWKTHEAVAAEDENSIPAASPVDSCF